MLSDEFKYQDIAKGFTPGDPRAAKKYGKVVPHGGHRLTRHSFMTALAAKEHRRVKLGRVTGKGRRRRRTKQPLLVVTKADNFTRKDFARFHDPRFKRGAKHSGLWYMTHPNKKSSPKDIVGHHGHKPHGPSILWPALYEHLRAKGMSKSKAARISNAAWDKKKVGLKTNTPTSVRGVVKSAPKVNIVRTFPTYAVHINGKPKFTGLYRRKTAERFAAVARKRKVVKSGPSHPTGLIGWHAMRYARQMRKAQRMSGKRGLRHRYPKVDYPVLRSAGDITFRRRAH